MIFFLLIKGIHSYKAMYMEKGRKTPRKLLNIKSGMSHGIKNYEMCIFIESLVYKTSTAIQPCIS
jgi:hypothetical protein